MEITSEINANDKFISNHFNRGFAVQLTFNLL